MERDARASSPAPINKLDQPRVRGDDPPPQTKTPHCTRLARHRELRNARTGTATAAAATATAAAAAPSELFRSLARRVRSRCDASFITGRFLQTSADCSFQARRRSKAVVFDKTTGKTESTWPGSVFRQSARKEYFYKSTQNICTTVLPLSAMPIQLFIFTIKKPQNTDLFTTTLLKSPGRYIKSLFLSIDPEHY